MMYTQQALAAGATASPDDVAGLHQLAAELYQRQGDTESALAELEAVRQLAPNDLNTMCIRDRASTCSSKLCARSKAPTP